MLSAGRSARGERWAFDRCSLGLALRRQGRTVLDESWLLDAAHGALCGRLGRFEALATVLLAGPMFASARAALRAQVDAVPVRARARLLESGSALGTDVLVVRFAATSVEELVGTLRDRLAAIPALLGDDPWRAARERVTHAPHAA